MLGDVVTLRRYPVKSMLGEEVPASEVTGTGLAGDRGLAVVSLRSGKVASAKYPRLWRDLLTLSAHAHPDGVRITLPDGKTITIASGKIVGGLPELGTPFTWPVAATTTTTTTKSIKTDTTSTPE